MSYKNISLRRVKVELHSFNSQFQNYAYQIQRAIQPISTTACCSRNNKKSTTFVTHFIFRNILPVKHFRDDIKR